MGAPSGPRPGDWACTACGAGPNFASRDACFKCGAQRPESADRSIVDNIGSNAPRPGDWTCQACGAGPVFASRMSCFKCNAPRPDVGDGANAPFFSGMTSAQMGASTSEARPGDWTCAACGAGPVFASRNDCFKCGAAKPGMSSGHSAPSTGKGAMRDGDWTCSVCGAGPVFASRNDCFKCGSPREGNDVGYGKGYYVNQGQSNRFSPYPPAANQGPPGGFGIKALLKLMSQGVEWRNDENTVVVTGLPEDSTDMDLYFMFTRFGAIAPSGCNLKVTKGTPRGGHHSGHSGTGFINFLESTGPLLAIGALNGLQLPNGQLLKARLWSAETITVPTRVGDWTCAKCGAGPVFATRHSCYKCGAARPPAQADQAGVF